MTKTPRKPQTLIAALLAALALAAAVVATPALAGSTTAPSGSAPANHRETIPFADARVKIEVNATDGDAGIHVFADVDGWRWLSVFDPDGRRILRTRATGSIGRQGGTELFLESAEPSFEEQPLEDFLDRFPEGEYRFDGRDLDGNHLAGAATLTHQLPDGPVLVSPIEGDPPQDPDATTLVWEPVAPPAGSAIIGYQVLVVTEDTGLPALPTITLDITLPPTATSLTVPAGFLQPDTEYEWEVLAIEESGNQTLSSAELTTAG